MSSATDIYALGCIGYYLLTTHPPFTQNPSDQHQNASFPDFDCDDTRLKSAILMMTAKRPETRPSSQRVRRLVEQVASGPIILAGTAAADLANVGSRITQSYARAQAEFEAQRTTKRTRNALVTDAFRRVRQIVMNLADCIMNACPAASREVQTLFVHYRLGQATLWVQVDGPAEAIHRDAFRESKWDVITFS